MDILKMILVLLLLGTWFPCTAHCQLMNGRSAQSLVGQRDANLQAASRSGSGEDCRICDWVTSGGYEQSQTKVVAPEFAAGFVPSFYQAILDEQSLALNTGCETQRSTAPPELAPTFHFTFRMSLPPRAPSLIS